MSGQQDRDEGAARREAEDLDAKRRLRVLVEAVVDRMEPIHPLTVADVLLAVAGNWLVEDLTVSRPIIQANDRESAINALADVQRLVTRLRQAIGLAP